MRRVTVGELVADGVLEFGDGYRTKRAEHGQPGFRILRVADVADGRISPTGQDFVAEEFRRQIGAKLSMAGDVLLTTKGTVGRVATVPPLDEQLVYSPQLCYFRVRRVEVLNPRFLQFWLKSPQFIAQASDRANNTDMAAYINMADIRSLVIALPGIEEQRAIAEVLTALDDKIAANMAHGHSAHELGQTLYELASRSWNFEPLANAMHSLLGATPARSNPSFWNGAVPWASAKDVAAAPLGTLLATSESISMLAAQSTKARPRPVGSVILTARGTVGAVARLGVSAAFNQSCYGFEPGPLPPAVLYFAIRAVAQQARSLVHGSVFDTITRSTFEHTLVPSTENTGIAEAEARLSPLLALVDVTVKENRVLTKTRDTLLPLLMSGKVRVKDVEKQVEEVV